MVDRLRLGFTSGMVSVGFWIVVYSPQIWECYVIKSGEGLSVLFLLIWLVGDITGLIGAIVQKLTATISLLAVYYMFCDITLLSMLYYYRHQRRVNPERFLKSGSRISRIDTAADEVTERSALLGGKGKGAGSHSSVWTKIVTWTQNNSTAIVAYTLASIFIAACGVFAWFASANHAGHGQGHLPDDSAKLPREEWSTVAQTFGWISAFTYLASRVPQIVKNTQTKCQGLSLMMFAFSVLGNVTYCGSILIPSTSAEHVWINFSWLVGSAGTIILDFVVLGQFLYYWKARNEFIWIAGGESEVSGI